MELSWTFFDVKIPLLPSLVFCFAFSFYFRITSRKISPRTGTKPMRRPRKKLETARSLYRRHGLADVIDGHMDSEVTARQCKLCRRCVLAGNRNCLNQQLANTGQSPVGYLAKFLTAAVNFNAVFAVYRIRIPTAARYPFVAINSPSFIADRPEDTSWISSRIVRDPLHMLWSSGA